MTEPAGNTEGVQQDETARPRRRVRWRRVVAIYIVGGFFCAGIYIAGQEYVARSAMVTRSPVRKTLAIGPLRRDFGPVAPGRLLRHELKIENRGEKDFILRRRNRSPESKEPETTLIPPGESRTIPISVRAPSRPGRMQEFIDWSTNDPDRPRIRFTVIATVRDTKPVHPASKPSM